jgi:hypothetical protein
MDTLDMELRLWEYIDGHSTAEEKTVVETLIRENAQWRALYQDLLQTHQSLTAIELEEPSLRFTKNVMEEIAKHHIAPATKKYINNKIIWGIGAFFILSIVGFLIYGFGQIDWSISSETTNPLGVDLSKVDYGSIFNSTVMNVFMMLNAVLGLMLLDRFLSNKRKKLYDAA